MKPEELVYKLSGGDYTIIEQCDAGVKKYFKAIGVCVAVIFILCFISSCFTFMHVFDQPVADVFLALFFSGMITNMYVLLLYTSEKNSLPHISATIRLSVIIRIGFVCFIALILSRPVAALLYASALDRDIRVYKTEVKKMNHDTILFYYRAQTNEIKRLLNNKTYQQQFIKEKEHERIRATGNMYGLVDSSYYYLQRIKFLNAKHPSAWLITILFMLVFILPVYLKHSMRGSNYYTVKSSMETNLVTSDYKAFKEKYTTIFQKKYNKQIVYSESYTDAPFNTERKTDPRKFYTQKDLLAELYNG